MQHLAPSNMPNFRREHLFWLTVSLLAHPPRILVDGLHVKYHVVVNVTRGAVSVEGSPVDVFGTSTALDGDVVPGWRLGDEVSYKLLEGWVERGRGGGEVGGGGGVGEGGRIGGGGD